MWRWGSERGKKRGKEIDLLEEVEKYTEIWVGVIFDMYFPWSVNIPTYISPPAYTEVHPQWYTENKPLVLWSALLSIECVYYEPSTKVNTGNKWWNDSAIL